MTARTREPSRQQTLYAADGRRKYLTSGERGRVLAALQALPPDKAAFGLTLAWTGARVSEVLSLCPASFQIDQGVVSVVTLKRRRLVVREIPVPDELLALLAARYDLPTRQLSQTESVKRLWPWCRETAWCFIRKAINDAGIVGRPACPRGLRHSFGVGTLQAGVPINLLSRWLGHASLASTAVYSDASGPEERTFAARFWQSVPVIDGH